MIWFAISWLSLIALAPLIWSVFRAARARDRRSAAIALHRAQLTELDRDMAEGRIGPAEHAAAVLEVQRRLLAAANEPVTHTARGARSPVLITIILVPLAAFALYLIGGSPDMPSMPLAHRIAAAKRQAAEEARLIGLLRERLAKMDVHSAQAREGYVLLGNAEASRGRMKEAAAAWSTALETQFDPTLAVEAAEAMTEAEGHVTPEAAALFRHALAEAPNDAPWRPMAAKRLSEVK